MLESTLAAGSAALENHNIQKHTSTIPGQPSRRTARITWAAFGDRPYDSFEVGLYYRATLGGDYQLLVTASVPGSSRFADLPAFDFHVTDAEKGQYPKYAVQIKGIVAGEVASFIIEDIIKN